MKQQSSVEFLLTYAWAFLSIAVFLAFILVVVTTSSPTSYNPATCYISPGLNCITAVLTTNSLGSKFILLFTNNLGQQITFPQNALRVYPGVGTTNYTGNCIPSNAPRGATVICNATTSVRIGQVGSQVNPKYTINYELCSPTCAYPVVSTNTINTTGFATLQISPYSANPIVNVTLLDQPTTGQIIVNGVSYPNNNILYLVNNLAYSIYGSPSSGYVFNSWIISNGLSVSLSTQTSSLKATAKGTLTATFVTTTSTTTSSSTTTTSTTSTSTSTSTSTTSTTSTSTSTSTSTTSTSTTSTSTTSSTTSTSTSTSTTTSTTSTTSTSTTTTAMFYSIEGTEIAGNIRGTSAGTMIVEQRFLAGSSMIGQTITDVSLVTYAYTGGGNPSGSYQIEIRDSNNNVVAAAPASAWNTGGAGVITSCPGGVNPTKYIFNTQRTIVAGDSVALDASNIIGSGAQQLAICGGTTSVPANSGWRYCNSDSSAPICPTYGSDNTGSAWYLGYN